MRILLVTQEPGATDSRSQILIKVRMRVQMRVRANRTHVLVWVQPELYIGDGVIIAGRSLVGQDVRQDCALESVVAQSTAPHRHQGHNV